MAKNVKIWYLGGLRDEKNLQERPGYVSVAGNGIALPDVGEAIIVRDYVARKLLKRKISLKNGTFDAFTTDANLARAVRERLNAKNNPKQAQLTKEEFLSSLSKDDLIAALESKADPEDSLQMEVQEHGRFLSEDEEPSDETEEDETEETDDEGTPKRRGRGRSNKN